MPIVVALLFAGSVVALAVVLVLVLRQNADLHAELREGRERDAAMVRSAASMILTPEAAASSPDWVPAAPPRPQPLAALVRPDGSVDEAALAKLEAAIFQTPEVDPTDAALPSVEMSWERDRAQPVAAGEGPPPPWEGWKM